LQEVLFPLLLFHNIFFLTLTRRSQFDLAMYIFTNNIKLYEKLGKITNVPSVFNLPSSAFDYLNLKFYFSWLVGFTVAFGSFLIKNNLDACFQLKERMHPTLFLSFKLLFDTNNQIYSEKNMYNQFTVSSKKDIQKVINFFSFSGHHPLIGLKSIQYLNWLNYLKNSTRYKDLYFPN
jgi:hypothetical protein